MVFPEIIFLKIDLEKNQQTTKKQQKKKKKQNREGKEIYFKLTMKREMQ